MSKTLHPLRILRQSSKLSMSAVLGFALTLGVNLAIGRYLLPEDVGILAVVGVWTFYSQLLKPGLLSTAGRDVPHLLGEGDHQEARRVQNVALSAELLFAVIPFIVVCVAALFYQSRIIRAAFWVGAASM